MLINTDSLAVFWCMQIKETCTQCSFSVFIFSKLASFFLIYVKCKLPKLSRIRGWSPVASSALLHVHLAAPSVITQIQTSDRNTSSSKCSWSWNKVSKTRTNPVSWNYLNIFAERPTCHVLEKITSLFTCKTCLITSAEHLSVSFCWLPPRLPLVPASSSVTDAVSCSVVVLSSWPDTPPSDCHLKHI